MISGLVPSPVTSLSVSNVSTTDIAVNWTIPSSEDGNYVTYYIISYTPSCPELSSVNDTVSVVPHQSITTYSYILRGLYSGMNYTITVRAGNVLGESDSTLTNRVTIPIAGTCVCMERHCGQKSNVALLCFLFNLSDFVQQRRRFFCLLS